MALALHVKHMEIYRRNIRQNDDEILNISSKNTDKKY